jgi:TolB-like protein/Tfp pilus assembly protein PilF
MLTADPSRAREPGILTQAEILLVRQHLKELAASHAFVGSKRAQDFLLLIVGHALEGEIESLRERMIGAEMFGRPIDYDTGSDSVVRVKATEVRKKLAQFYLETETKPLVRIELPIGSYVPRFFFEDHEPTTSTPKIAPGIPPTSEQAEQIGYPSPATQTELLNGKTADQPGTPSIQSANEPNGARGESPQTPHSAQTPQNSSPQSSATIAKIPERFTPRLLLSLVIGLLLITAAGAVGWFEWYRDSHARAEIRSIAILPLKNLSGDPTQEYFADGMTEELINSLGQVSTLRVISLTSAMTYKGTKKKLPEIAKELAVDGVVEGSVLREGTQVRITAQLIDAKTDRPIWAHEYVRDMTSVLALQGEVAQAVADEVRINMTPQEQARLARTRPIDPAAQDLYMHGILQLGADDCSDAVEYFHQALAKNPNYAQAHAASAICYGRMGESGKLAYKVAFPMQKAEAQKAIALDDSLPEGHAELANTAMTLDWDWATAAAEFRRAQQLNPNSAPIHEKYAFYLVRTGHPREATAEVERSLDLDPVSVRSLHNAGFIYYFSRQYDQALSLSHRVQGLNIHPPDWSFLLGDVYAEKGMYAQSIAEFLKSGNGPDSLGHLGNVYARAGHAAEARKMIALLEDRVQKDGVGAYEIALIYAGLGKKPEALQWLDKAFQGKDVGLVYLKIDPCLDPLRGDPHFDDLVRRVGLIP